MEILQFVVLSMNAKKASLQHLVGRGAAILKSWLVLENETPIEALIGDKKSRESFDTCVVKGLVLWSWHFMVIPYTFSEAI